MVNTYPDLSARGATSPRLRGLTVVILVILTAQFLLGMAVNLFVTIPSNHPGANPPEYFSGVFQSVKWAMTSASSVLERHDQVGLPARKLWHRTLVSCQPRSCRR